MDSRNSLNTIKWLMNNPSDEDIKSLLFEVIKRSPSVVEKLVVEITGEDYSSTIPLRAIGQLRIGKKIHAIKVVREVLGLSLKDAKELVDEYVKTHPEDYIDPATGLPPRKFSDLIPKGF